MKILFSDFVWVIQTFELKILSYKIKTINKSIVKSELQLVHHPMIRTVFQDATKISSKSQGDADEIHGTIHEEASEPQIVE